MSQSEKVVEGLGGIDNIRVISTVGSNERALGAEVKDPDLVNDTVLKAAGAASVGRKDNEILMDFGLGGPASIIAQEIRKMLQ